MINKYPKRKTICISMSRAEAKELRELAKAHKPKITLSRLIVKKTLNIRG